MDRNVSYTTQLATYAASLRYEDLPHGVVKAAKRATLDLLGVIFPAVQYAPARLMNDYVRRQGGGPIATVVGTDIRSSTANAALANGTMAAEMEQDDVHPESGTHPGSVFVPAMLAVAEDLGSNGRHWIAGLVAAYDVGCRIATAMEFPRTYKRGFHSTGVAVAFGGAAGAGRLLKLDAAGMESALGLYASQACGLLTYQMERDHFVKSLQSGVPARNAVTSAELAAMGYVGAPGVLDGEYNVFDAFSTHDNFPALVKELGVRYEIEHTGYKFYSACRAIHTPLDMLLDQMAEHRFGPDDVARMRVWLPAPSIPVVNNNKLTTHNLQFIMAAGLVDREITRVQISNERRADTKLNEIASRVSLLPDSGLEGRHPGAGMLGPARIEVTLRDRRKFEDERPGPRGSNVRPVTDGDIEAKFLQMATQSIPEKQARGIIDCVASLEHLTDMRELSCLLVKER